MLRIVAAIATLAVVALVLDSVIGTRIGLKVYLVVSGENWASDGPVLGFAGGRLAGSVAAPPPAWSVMDEHYVVEIEVRPEDPYSVNLLCVSVGDRLYVASGSGPDATWAHALGQNPNLRLRVEDEIYELQATRVTDPAEIDAYLGVLGQKYGVEAPRSEFLPTAGARASAPLFRLEGNLVD